VHVFVYHVPVQGEGCGARIAEGLRYISRHIEAFGGADVLLLSRGGGSLEDLWGFNEEAVARAIARRPIPVVTGIGHEVDTSIADLVADYHAPYADGGGPGRPRPSGAAPARRSTARACACAVPSAAWSNTPASG
jgi:exodeoxyribonuclease VII large subunit